MKQAQHLKKQLGKKQIMSQKVLEQRRVMTQSKQDEKIFWDIWKATTDLFKESKQIKAVTTLEERQAMAQSKGLFGNRFFFPCQFDAKIFLDWNILR